MLYVTSCRNLAAQTLPRSGSKKVYHGSNYDQISLVIRGFSGTLTAELQFTWFGILISMKQTSKQTNKQTNKQQPTKGVIQLNTQNFPESQRMKLALILCYGCSLVPVQFLVCWHSLFFFWLHSVHNCVRIHFESLHFKAKNCSNTHSCRPSSFINSTKRNEKITNLPSSASSACSPVNKNQDVYYSWPKSENILTEALSMIKFSSQIFWVFIMTINNKTEKKMTETSASVCLLLTTVLLCKINRRVAEVERRKSLRRCKGLSVSERVAFHRIFSNFCEASANLWTWKCISQTH